MRTSYVTGYRTSARERDRTSFGLWFEKELEGNELATYQGQIWWEDSEIDIRRWGREHPEIVGVVSEEPPAICDVVLLLEACARPDAAHERLLTTIDLLDDIRETADGLNAEFLDPSGALNARRVHDELREAFFDECDLPEALARAGGASAVINATLEMVGRIALATQRTR